MLLYKFSLMFSLFLFLFGFFYGMNFVPQKAKTNVKRKLKKNQITLKDKIDVLTNTPSANFFKKQSVETSKWLEESGQGNKYKTVKIASVLLGLLGFVVAYLFKNVLLAPILVFAFAGIPYAMVQLQRSKHRKKLLSDLERTLSLITTSYLRSENIADAIRENLGEIPQSIRKVFEEFCFENDYISPNLNTSLNNMKLKINNPIFHEWVNALIQCSENKDVKQILLPTIEKFSTLRTVQSDVDVAMGANKVEAVIMACISLGVIPILRVINMEWYGILVNTTQGKVSLALAFLIVIYCLYQIVALSQPLEYYEKDSD